MKSVEAVGKMGPVCNGGRDTGGRGGGGGIARGMSVNHTALERKFKGNCVRFQSAAIKAVVLTGAKLKTGVADGETAIASGYRAAIIVWREKKTWQRYRQDWPSLIGTQTQLSRDRDSEYDDCRTVTRSLDNLSLSLSLSLSPSLSLSLYIRERSSQFSSKL